MTTAGLLVLALAGCSDEPPRAVQRKELLRPDEIHRRQIEDIERLRIFDAQGELLPSGEELAELELPKGVTLYRKREREFHLEAPRITVDKLERYFAARLEPIGVVRSEGAVTFESAKVKASPTAPPVTVRIARVRATEPASEIMLRVAPPPRVFPSEEAVQQELAERAKYAD